MILSGTGIIDSNRGPSLPAEIVVGTGSTVANKIVYSTQNDGSSWGRYSGNFVSNATVYDTVYANNLWVSVGVYFKLQSTLYYNIAYSVDGINWEFTNPSPNFITLYKVEYAGGKFLAIGNTSSYFTSIDGITWTEQLGLSSLLPSMYSVTYFNGAWYISGQDGSSYGRVYKSTDAVSWTAVFNTSPNQSAAVALGTNGSILTLQIAFVNETWYSNTGTTWTKGSTVNTQGQFFNQFATCVWAGAPINKFVLGGFYGSNTSSKMRVSSDGKTWTAVDTSAIFGTTSNTSVSVYNFNWDGTYLWFVRANTGQAGYTGVVFRTTDMVNFTTMVTNTSISSLGYNVYSIATKP